MCFARWRTCSRNISSTLPSIVQTLSTSLRRKLIVVAASYEQHLSHTSHTTPLSPDVDVELSNLLELIRLSAEELETIAGRSRSQQTTEITNGNTSTVALRDMVGLLSRVADDVSNNLEKLVTLAENHRLLIDLVQADGVQTKKEVEVEKLSTWSNPVFLRQTSKYEDGRLRQKSRSTPVTVLNNVISDDYDVPKSEFSTSSMLSVSGTESWPRLLRRSGIRHQAVDDMALDKRVAIVIENQPLGGSNSFELRERRQHLDELLLPSKMVASRSMEALNMGTDSVDYDIPVPQSVLRQRHTCDTNTRGTCVTVSPTTSTAGNDERRPVAGSSEFFRGSRFDIELDAIKRSSDDIMAMFESIEVESLHYQVVDCLRSLLIAIFRVVYIGDMAARRKTASEAAKLANELSQYGRQLAGTWQNLMINDAASWRLVPSLVKGCTVTANMLINTVDLTRHTQR